MRVIGIDPGLANLGLVALANGEVHHHEHITCSDPGSGRLAFIYAMALREAEWAWPTSRSHRLAVIEGYAFDRGDQAHQMGEAGGAIRLGLFDGGCRFIVLPPSSLKKWVCGKGNADPTLLPKDVLRHWGWDPPSQHEAAAYALARFGEAVLLREAGQEPEGLVGYQREVLDAWFAPPVKPKRKKKRVEVVA